MVDSSSSSQKEGRLSLRKQLNFPYILEKGILTYYQSVLAQEYSEKEIIESIKAYVSTIPSDWKDKEWKKESDEAKKTKRIDKRPIVAGRTRMSLETCERLGISAFEEKEVIDYYAMFQACINLLNRRRMLVKPDPTQELDHIELEKFAEAEAR